MIDSTEQKQLHQALTSLENNDGIIVVPTDTTYGVICRLDRKDAIARIYREKGRDSNKPLIILGHDADSLENWAAAKHEQLRLLSKKFWPGALTIVVPAANTVPKEILAGLQTVGLRVPDHDQCRALLEQLPDKSAASTSANLSGSGIPKDLADVQATLHGKVNFIMDSGSAPQATESTIVDISGDKPVILRRGAINPEDIFAVLGVKVDR
jgi:L-threonylcarbamoyladenylate synthase